MTRLALLGRSAMSDLSPRGAPSRTSASILRCNWEAGFSPCQIARLMVDLRGDLPKGCNVPQLEELRTSSWCAAMLPYVGGCPLLGEERTTYAQGEFFAF